MMDRQRFAVTELVVVLIVLWLSFAVHRSPQFPGSLTGGVLAISGAALMVLVTIFYGLIKSISPLKRLITRSVSMKALLTWHVYTSVVGAIFALLHTGHKLDNPLGIALVTTMLFAVLSGYIARYFLSFVSEELREKQVVLSKLQAEYKSIGAEVSLASEATSVIKAAAALPRLSLGMRARLLAGSIADVEYSIKTHTLLKRRASRWLKLHAIVSGLFYLLLTLHVWAMIHFGIRWLR